MPDAVQAARALCTATLPRGRKKGRARRPVAGGVRALAVAAFQCAFHFALAFAVLDDIALVVLGLALG